MVVIRVISPSKSKFSTFSSRDRGTNLNSCTLKSNLYSTVYVKKWLCNFEYWRNSMLQLPISILQTQRQLSLGILVELNSEFSVVNDTVSLIWVTQKRSVDAYFRLCRIIFETNNPTLVQYWPKGQSFPWFI